MIEATKGGGRIYICDICGESIGYWYPTLGEPDFSKDGTMITILSAPKGPNFERHVHKECLDKVFETIKKVGERRKNERKRT